MTFTQAQINTVNNPSSTGVSSSTPKFDPNASTMQTLPPTNTGGNEIENGLKTGAEDAMVYSNNILNSTAEPLENTMTEVNNEQNNSESGKENPLEAGENEAGDIGGGIADSIGGAINSGVISPLGKIFGNIPGASTVANSKYSVASAALNELDSGSKALANVWNEFVKSSPKTAQQVADGGNIAKFMALFAGDSDEAQTAAQKVSDTVKQGVDSVKEGLKTPEPTPEDVENDKNANLQKVVDAVSPDEKGKNLVSAYKDVVKGNRTADMTGNLKTQTLAPSDNAVELGTRLSDIKGLSSDNTHLDNLKALGGALDDTESKIGELTKNDTTTGTRDELNDKLDSLKATRPSEFKIKTPTASLYNKVVDFAKKVVDTNDESTEGFRNGRSIFDSQAKREFPSAYKNGVVDTTTPAGSAIKNIRDTWNRYTYDNSSVGKELEGHIQREADIFRAAENIAPKAAEQDGSNAIERYLDQHPVLGSILNFGKRVATRAAAGGIISSIKGAIK